MKFGVVLILVVLCVVGGEQCTTPAGSPGSCIQIFGCETLMNLLRKPQKTTEDIGILQRSSCGFDGKIPKVCCPDDFCFTPDAQEGRCVSQNSCPHIEALLSQPTDEIRAFVRNSKCGPDSDAPRVCCGKQPPNLGPTNGKCSSTVAPQYPGSKCCGIESSTSDRITGGEDANIDQYPWLALIEYSKDNRIMLLCGGSLISGRYVLTAGHCVVGPVLDVGIPTNVRLGEYDTRNNPSDEDCQPQPGGDEDCTSGAVVIPIKKIIAHEQYKPYHHLKRNDIALLRLKEMAPYTDFIRPICLPQTDISSSSLPDINTDIDIRFSVAGWGAVNETHRNSPIKQFVEVPYSSMDVCQSAYRKRYRTMQLWEGQICAGGELGKDSCKGDSGGPLIYYRGMTCELVGVVSFGPNPCGIENMPGVYTKVHEYLPWIRKNIEP